MTSMLRRLIAITALVLGLGASVGTSAAIAATPHAAPSSVVHTSDAGGGDWWWD